MKTLLMITALATLTMTSSSQVFEPTPTQSSFDYQNRATRRKKTKKQKK